MQTGSLITAIPEIQKNKDITLQKGYQVFLANSFNSFMVQSHGRIVEHRKKLIREKYPSDLIRMQGFRLYFEEKGYLLVGI